MSAITVQEFQGYRVRFEIRKDNQIWGCLTDMAKATGKNINDYLRLKSTQEFFQYLLKDIQGITETGIPVTVDFKGFEAIVEVNRGNFTGKEQGTWAIEEIVIDFAQWCSIPFRVWANRVLKYLLRKTSTAIVVEQSQEEDSSLALTTEDVIERVVLQMKKSVEDPLALSRYAKSLDSLNATLHRHQPEMLSEVGSVLDFLHRYTVESENSQVTALNMYRAYKRFCKNMKYETETQTYFGRIAAKIYKKKRKSIGVCYEDVKLLMP